MEIDEESKKWLTRYQIEYWKDPEKKRAQQRAKYAKYPEKIYAMNRAWQKKNKEHFSKLLAFAYKIRKAKAAGDTSLVQVLVKAKEEYKKAWREAKSAKANENERRIG